MKIIKFSIVYLFFLSMLTACGGSSGFDFDDPRNRNENENDLNQLASLDCTASIAFDPVAAGFTAPIETLPAAEADTNNTIILMHGKTASPASDDLTSFQTDMANKGYKVIAPVMPWSTTEWKGRLCEGMVYITQLAEAEIAAGREVIIAGHSMGGTYALIYGETQPNAAVKALITIAPEHMMHVSQVLQTATANEVNKAKILVNAGNGDETRIFSTLRNLAIVNLSTTANIYLTYHNLEVVPNLNFVLPNITFPVLWFAGETDPLTTEQGTAALAATITSTGSEYQTLVAGHNDIVALTPEPLEIWLNGLGN